MEVFVGTSGWYYDWNEERNLEWFVRNSGLNAVELNASFYRFPFPNQIVGWSRKGSGLRWAVKVSRLVTHQHKFNQEALRIWERFSKLFKPLDKFIEFYLFQGPPSFSDAEKMLDFAKKTRLGERFAFEIRNRSLLGNDDACKKLQKAVTLVSVDSPDFRNRVFPGKIIYLRMHGRGSWYSYNYSEAELRETAERIFECKPGKVYVFFNNNHDMLENARRMKGVLES
ncbi:MAG: DUF72 domain-containing protein [Candidatus Aenigmatarchaeota archaeon]